jgi:hypothetical protein
MNSLSIKCLCWIQLLFVLMAGHANSQTQCRIIDSERKNCKADTCFFLNDSSFSLFLVEGHNDKIYSNGKKILQLKRQVLFYEEFDFFELKNNYGIYFFPVYVGQVGPYVTLNKQGVVILYSKKSGKIKVIKDHGFYEKYFLCDSLNKHIEDIK